MSDHVWHEDAEADARFLIRANLPESFWQAVAVIVGDAPGFAAGKFTLGADVLDVQRSYLLVTRDGRRLKSISAKTLQRAWDIRQAECERTEAERVEAARMATVVWEPD